MKIRRFMYLDHSATTPLDERVIQAMQPYFAEIYGNPLSSHSFGRKADNAVERAREVVAGVFNCNPSEVIFTSGGTESDNLAVRGAALAARQTHNGRQHLITTPVEHPAVTRTVAQLGDVMGFDITLLPVDCFGLVNVGEFAAGCRPGTVLASIIYANNEVGTISPLAQIAEQARARGVLLHTDAVQAAGQSSLDVQELGVDMMSISAHKFYGPKGIGALYVRNGVTLLPSQSGGSHEEGRRGGTHNVPAIVGLAKALEIAHEEFDQHTTHYRLLRDQLIDGITSRIPAIQLTGHPTQRLASHASFVIDGVDSNTILMHLDLKGIAASSASACKTGNARPSEVLLAMGYQPEEASSSLRLSVGRQTTTEDVEYVIDVLAETVERVRKLERESAR
jgi:cysteine desulfurase